MATAKVTTDHDEIRQWVEDRGGTPVTASRTEHRGALRIDFPATSTGDDFDEITWDEWFAQFDDENLAALYEDEPVNEEMSQWFELVDRENVEESWEEPDRE